MSYLTEVEQLNEEQQEYVSVTTPGFPYVFLSPRFTPARSGDSHGILIQSKEHLDSILPELLSSSVVALDLETKGTDPWRGDTDQYVVGIGLAYDSGSLYLDSSIDNGQLYKYLLHYLLDNRIPLIAHNAYFDGQWTFRDLEWKHLNWVACTYGLYMQLAGEGFIGQTWGLKDAQRQILLWPQTNELELDNWLRDNGHVKQSKAVDKGQMWRAPADILGKYCILDAESTYLLYTTQFLPWLDKIPALDEFHRGDFIYSIQLHIEQRFCGIEVDRAGLFSHSNKLTTEASKLTADFLGHETVAPLLQTWNEEQHAKYIEAHPEPNPLKKDGTPSKIHANWVAKTAGILQGTDTKYTFNPTSGAQLRWLFHDKLGLEISEYTETGLPKLDKKVLGTREFGELGKLLINRGELLKENSYIESYIHHTENSRSIHPSYRIPGTVTGRVSGKDPNILQAPKTVDVFSMFKARRGHKLLDLDFCLHPDTEVLTKSGWKTIDKLVPETEEVWQVDPYTLVGSWTIPSRIINKEYSGKMYIYGNIRGKLHVTENHRMLFTGQLSHPLKSKRDKRRFTLAQDGITATDYHMVTNTTGNTGSGPRYSSKELWLVTLVQADGSERRRKGVVTGYNVTVAKERKRNKILELLGREGSPLKEIEGYLPREYWNVSSKEINTRLLGPGKKFNLSSLAEEQADEFLEALTFWDGYKVDENTSQYYSTNEHNIDEVQAFFVRSGYEANKKLLKPKGNRMPIWSLTIRNKRCFRLGKQDVSSYDYTGKVTCVTVDSGYILVRSGGQTFVTGNCALEPNVATELSQCPGMLQVYGPGALDNDIYLFVSAAIPEYRTKFASVGYDPYNPTPEAISAAKKMFKKERGVLKVIHLGASYGAGPGKLYKTLQMDGVDISFDEVAALHKGYWELFSGVKQYGYQLQKEWRRNGGYVLSGLGTPIAIAEELLKDAFNRVCQTTGHQILMKYNSIYTRKLTEEGIPWNPIIIDWHDASTIEVPDEYVNIAAEIMGPWAVAELNRQLGGTIELKGDVEIGDDLAQVKKPEA